MKSPASADRAPQPLSPSSSAPLQFSRLRLTGDDAPPKLLGGRWVGPSTQSLQTPLLAGGTAVLNTTTVLDAG